MNFLRLCLLLTIGFTIVSCGGGGSGSSSSSASSGGTEITGNVAAGAAMSYAEIRIRGYAATDELVTYADIDGNFTVPSTLKNFPALVIATSANGKQTFYGYIKSASQKTVAVNPITTTLLGLAAKSKNYDLYSLTDVLPDSNLATAQSDTASIFGQFLDATNVNRNTDFLTTTFQTDHSGLDLILDYLSAYVDRGSASGAVYITNKLDGKSYQITPNLITPIEFNSASQSVASILSSNNALSKCTTFIKALGDKIATDSSVYSPDFLDSGLNGATYRSKMRNSLTSGIRFTSPFFQGIDSKSNYVFSSNIHNISNNEFVSGLDIYTKIDAQGNCKLAGNNHPFEISIQPAIKHSVRYDGMTIDTTTAPVAGLEIQIGAWQNLGDKNVYEGVNVGEAVVEVCELNSNCREIARLTSPGLTGVFQINDPKYRFLNMIQNPNVALINGNPNPIKITFLDSSRNPIGTPIYTKVIGEKFTDDDISTINIPEITNAEVLFNTPIARNPTVDYKSNGGTISSIKIYSGTTNKEKLILKSGTGSYTFNDFDFSGVNYRSIYISKHFTGKPGIIETKYFQNAPD